VFVGHILSGGRCANSGAVASNGSVWKKWAPHIILVEAAYAVNKQQALGCSEQRKREQHLEETPPPQHYTGGGGICAKQATSPQL
jgi:hypothetical protein